MSEINTDLRDELLRKHADSCTPEELLKNFEYFYEKYGDYVCPQKSGDFWDCLFYVKKLLSKFKPEIGMVEMFGDVGDFEFKREYVEEAYIYYLALTARIEAFYNNYTFAAFYAKKALDLVNYFRPHMNDLSKAKLIQEDKNYKAAYDIYEQYKAEYVEWAAPYSPNDFLFDWEQKFYSPATIANQNFE